MQYCISLTVPRVFYFDSLLAPNDMSLRQFGKHIQPVKRILPKAQEAHHLYKVGAYPGFQSKEAMSYAFGRYSSALPDSTAAALLQPACCPLQGEQSFASLAQLSDLEK